MRGEFHGLQALILSDCTYAYYVHCFAHRLQLALVASEVLPVDRFFAKLLRIVNIVSASCKRNDELKAAHADDIAFLISIEELETGRGLNQIGNLQPPGDTRWSSHLKSVSSLIKMYSAACMVLLNIYEDGPTSREKLVQHIRHSFEFVFILHLIKSMLGITNSLCLALQSKTQDILKNTSMVLSTKSLLQNLRDDEFDYLVATVKLFCESRNIDIPDLNAKYFLRYDPTRDNFSVLDRYRVDIFYRAIDSQIQELNRRFDEQVMELLVLSSTLNPNCHSSVLKIDDICLLVDKFYPEDFTEFEKSNLKLELRHYENCVISQPEYKSLSSISKLCQWLVEIKWSTTYQLVYRIVFIVLTLPVSTATAERSFSAMNIIKTSIRNKMEADYLEDCMMMYIEKDIASKFSTETIIDTFANASSRRVHFF